MKYVVEMSIQSLHYKRIFLPNCARFFVKNGRCFLSGIARLTKVSRCSTFALRVTPGVIPAIEPESRLKSEIDACGVRGFIGTACALPIGIARLPKRSLRLRFALRACPDLVRVKASRVAFHFVPLRGSRTHYSARNR